MVLAVPLRVASPLDWLVRYYKNTKIGVVMQPYQLRAIEEKAELEKRAKALSDFIGLSPIFETLDPVEQERMKEQNDTMWKYYEILSDRIAHF